MILTSEFYMEIALNEARIAGLNDEVPVGACVVSRDGKVLSFAGNRTVAATDPTGHAEIVALRDAASEIENYRLTECSLYTTIEPCVMCAGALVNARIERLVIGAADERFGAVRSLFNLCDNEKLNHRMEIEFGVKEKECRELIQEFFRKKRSLKS